MKKILAFLSIILFAAPLCASNRLKTYEAPEGVMLNNDFTVRVRVDGGKWMLIPTFLFNVDNVVNGGHKKENTSVAKFDFEGIVEVEVNSMRANIKDVQIRPLSYNIKKSIEGNTIKFVLDRPRYISVEVNGDIYRNLQIFADKILEKPKVEKHKLMYFGPGFHDCKGDSIKVSSGETVYIDGGAVINGWFSANNVKNVKIIGHGIINPGHHEGIMVKYSKNVIIDGPLTTQIPVGGSDSITIRNAKVISWYGWGDGMNVFASNNVSYNHVFCRTSDDCSTIYCTRLGYYGGCKNISINDAVYWADVAHPIMIGLHGDVNKHETIENVLYNNVDILEQNENQIDYQGCIGINNGDNNIVRNITFSNIRVEDIHKGMLINMRVCYNRKYCHAPGSGIENITFRNFSYNGTHAGMSIIAGYDDSREISNIKFENFSINGKTIYDDMPDRLKWYKTSDYANIFVGEHVEDISFIRSE